MERRGNEAGAELNALSEHILGAIYAGQNDREPAGLRLGLLFEFNVLSSRTEGSHTRP